MLTDTLKWTRRAKLQLLSLSSAVAWVGSVQQECR